jgi:hypothetical protein
MKSATLSASPLTIATSSTLNFHLVLSKNVFSDGYIIVGLPTRGSFDPSTSQSQCSSVK